MELLNLNINVCKSALMDIILKFSLITLKFLITVWNVYHLVELAMDHHNTIV
jgi:hypothetical protein